jgi:tetratricopeptide (TPR) repeat protein
MKKDFFISYTSADRSWADWIAWELREAGYSTIHQAWNFRPGSNFISDMKQALDDSERTIAVYSPNYFHSGFSEDEWTAAFADRSLIPVRVRECEIPKLLKPRLYIDVVNLNEQAARTTLLAGVTREAGPPTERPAFPSTTGKPNAFPGAPPPIWGIPHARNPNFTGRDAMLEKLHSSLSSGRQAAITQAIAGLGGVGKTQLALEYTYRFASGYKLVWWLRAEEPSTLASDFARLATRLNLPEKDLQNQPEIVAAVLRWLEQNSGWLLIFDNATAPEQCDDYRPRANTGHIVITSRNPAWRGVAEPLRVQQLSRAESIAFLSKRTGRDEPGAGNALSDALGDLPLALEHAGAYIESNGISIGEYLRLYRQYSSELLEPVEATWAISFDKLQAENPAALDLLNLIAFLAPDKIPRDLLQSTAATPIAFNKSVEGLRCYSLIETGEGTISVHRLVQKVTRERLDEQDQRRCAEAALKLVDDAFPSRAFDYTSWPVCSRLLAHAIEAANRSETLQAGLEFAARVLNQVGVYQTGRGQLRTGREMFERALRIDEKLHGSDDPNVAVCVNNIGQILQAQGDLDSALQYTRRAFEIDEKAYGPDHPNVAIRASNIGAILAAQGDLDGALRYTRRALEIDEKTSGPDHPNVAIRASNIGQILKAQGDVDGALRYTRRALGIDEKAYGPDHPEVATDANNIGQILKVEDDLEGALPYLERALRIFRSTYGIDHPSTKTVAKNLQRLQAALAARKSFNDFH